jgi:hypothetical protein
LSQRHIGDDMVGQVGGGAAHASPAARWAYSPLLARKRDKQVLSAGSASCSGKTISVNSTPQECVELFLHILR